MENKKELPKHTTLIALLLILTSAANTMFAMNNGGHFQNFVQGMLTGLLVSLFVVLVYTIAKSRRAKKGQ